MQATSTDGLAADGIYAGSSPPLGSGFLRAMCLIAAVLAVAACGRGSSADEAGRRPTDVGLAQYPGVLAQIGVALSDVPEGQRDALRDGIVTFAEYEAAAFAVVECVRDLGYTILTGPELDPSGLLVLFTYGLGQGDLEDARQHFLEARKCHDDYLSLVLQVWLWQNQPTEDQLQAARSTLLHCLETSGVHLPHDPPPELLSGLAEVHPACFEQVQREFRIPQFRGYY